jgi:hypothetical protein
MKGWLCIGMAWLVLATFAAGVGCCSGKEDLDTVARIMIGNVRDGGGRDEPVTFSDVPMVARKSVARAMLLSAVLPGLGQIYAGGRRGYVSGGAMAATDVFSLWGYFHNNSKGDDTKDQYEEWVRDHFDIQRFESYVRDTVVVFSGYEGFNFCTDPGFYDSAACWDAIYMVFPLAEEGSGAFYEQIDVDDKFVFGWNDWTMGDIEYPEDLWKDWNPYSDLPDGVPRTSSNRAKYKAMRSEADDFYGRADRFAWIMVIGRVVSMIDAAILVKLRNRDIASIGTNPRLSFKAKLGGNPTVKVGLKMRF